MSKLVLDNVSRRFGGVTAVDSFSLALARGEFVSLLGPSGCGKTTTLRMIAGFLPPSEGTIAMDGVVISSPVTSLPPEKRNMSMIFQSYAIWPNMTVAENVAFGLEVRRLPRAEIRSRVDRILDVVQMRHLGASVQALVPRHGSGGILHVRGRNVEESFPGSDSQDVVEEPPLSEPTHRHDRRLRHNAEYCRAFVRGSPP